MPRRRPAVRPDGTRGGLGRRIVEECEAAAAERGFGLLALMATDAAWHGFQPLEGIDDVLEGDVRLAYVATEQTISGLSPALLACLVGA